MSAQARGTATVTVTADDGNGGTVEDTFTVTVKAAPVVASAIADVSELEIGATHEVSLSGVFSDADGDDLTVTATSSNESVATVAVAADYTTLTVSAKARGTATITVTAADGDGGSVEESFTVTVKAAPVVASAIADVSELEVGATHEVSLSGVFSDADGDALVISAASSDSAVVHVSNTIDPLDRVGYRHHGDRSGPWHGDHHGHGPGLATGTASATPSTSRCPPRSSNSSRRSNCPAR